MQAVLNCAILVRLISAISMDMDESVLMSTIHKHHTGVESHVSVMIMFRADPPHGHRLTSLSLSGEVNGSVCGKVSPRVDGEDMPPVCTKRCSDCLRVSTRPGLYS